MEDSEKSFGLCLSGGGFRATLYHLGVIKFLRDAGALKDVTHIFSVSGGSILAAHLVLNWEKYTGSEADFEEAAQQVVELTRSDVRGRIIRKWILSWLLLVIRPLIWLLRKFNLLKKPDWRITNLLASIYSKFYRYKDGQGNWEEAKLSDFKGENSSRPDIQILSTSVTTGRLCSFDKLGLTLMNETKENKDERHKRIETDRFPVSTAVAASSAFPPVFSPVAITKEMFQAVENEFPHTEYLTDGGVYDNLGIRRLLLKAEEESLEFDRIFLSDAGTAFDSKLNEPFSFILSLSIRASNLLMMRVGNLEYLGLKKLTPTDTKVAVCKIQDKIEAADEKKNIKHSLGIVTQRALQGIRTDLNTFNPWEINVLTQHGYATARKAYIKGKFSSEDSQIMTTPPWMPKSTRAEWNSNFDLDKQMKSARRRKWGLLSMRDSSSWLSLGIILLMVTIPFGVTIYGIFLSFILENQKNALQVEKSTLENEKKELIRKNNESIIDIAEENPEDIETLQKANEILTRNLETLSPNEPEYKSIDDKIKNFSSKIAKMQTVVKIKISDADNKLNTVLSSGFFVSPDGYILTSDYLSKPNSKTIYTVQLADGLEKSAELVKTDAAKHITLLKIDGGSFNFLNYNTGKIIRGESILVIGYLSGSELRLENGKITAFSNDLTQIQFDKDAETLKNSVLTPYHGFGGGPVINGMGDVIGIYYSSDGKSARNFIPITRAVPLLNEVGIQQAAE
jgi:S1-C subfamily serine protease/predicted acylesterase/phospholipase RssA